MSLIGINWIPTKESSKKENSKYFVENKTAFYLSADLMV